MSDILISQATRHSLFVQRFAGHLANLFDERITQLNKEIKFLILTNDDFSTQKKIDRLLKQVKEAQQIIYSAYNTETLYPQLKELGIGESRFEFDSLENALLSSSVKLSLPASAQVWAAVTSSPLIFESSNQVQLLESFIKDMQDVEIKRVQDSIRTGIITGRTNSEIVLDIVGRNQIVDRVVRQKTKAMVRTAVNHVSASARILTMMSNDDIVKGYRFAVVFDGRTSSTCRAYGQENKVYLLTDRYQPKPPFHIGCRTTMYAVLIDKYEIDDSKFTKASKGSEGGAQIKGDETPYSWLKKQSAEFQDDAIGVTKGKLLRNGGLTSDQFAQLTVDELFRPMTLVQMYERNPLAFRRANIDPPI